MSYVERALYDYVKKILTEGLQVLFSKRFIIFTFLLLISGGLAISIVYFENQQNIPFETVKLAFLLLTSFSLGFIVAGLIAKRFLSTVLRFIVMVIVVIFVLVFGLISFFFPSLPDTITTFYLEIYPILCFLLWTLLMPIASFGFAKGLFFDKIIGSALFLGKPVNDHRAIFSGIFALLSVGGLFIGIFMIFREELIIAIAGILSIILSILIFLITLGILFRNDALNSAFSLFFVVSVLPTITMLALSAENNTITILNYALLAFSLIYTAQGQAKRASRTSKMTKAEIQELLEKEKEEKTKDDPYFINKTLRFIGSEGIVLIFLGTFLGYVALQLQVTRDIAETSLNQSTENILNPIFRNTFNFLTAGQVYQGISIMFILLITLLIIISYIIFPSVRAFYTADLYRFEWLPSYDEAKAYFEKVQTGEIGVKDVSADVMKAVGSAAIKSARSAGASIFKRLTGRRNKELKE